MKWTDPSGVPGTVSLLRKLTVSRCVVTEGVNRQTGFCRKALTQPPALRFSSSALPESHPVPCVCARTPVVPIEVIQAVHLVLAVQGKALIADAPGTGHTREAGWVEGPAQGPDKVFLDHLATLATLLQGILGQRAMASESSYTCGHSKKQGASHQKGPEGQGNRRGAQIHALGP